MEDIFSNLNKSQAEAVQATEGFIKVVAGAGAGKTRVLAHRFAYLVNELGISPSNILCMTFTNKAAREMKLRIGKMVERGNVNDFICTIHGFCVKVLRREIYRIGYPKNFTILDEDDAKALAVQAMEEFGIDRRKTTAERFLKKIAEIKGYDPNAYILKYMVPAAVKSTPDEYVRYMKLQTKYYALDFDDLVYFTIHILEHYEDARKYWTDKLNYIMVDEVQDCSGDDWHLIRLIASGHKNLFVVGDPDQAIYEWRGAKPKLFVDFKADRTIILNRNYRSVPEVLNVANAIIAHNRNRIPKDLYTELPSGAKVRLLHADSGREEADWVASVIEKSVKEGASYSDHAVLYRSSYSSRLLEQALINRKIPYRVWGGVRFFERREIKDLICYLRLIVNPADDRAFMRVVNVPSRKFGKQSLSLLKAMGEASGMSLYDTLVRNLDDKKFGRPAMKQFVAMIEGFRLMEDMLSVSEMADKVLKDSGLDTLYRTAEEEERLENISELINSMHQYELANADEEEGGSTSEYLQDIALYTNADYADDGDAVRTMTIHQAKGLEFPTVFVMGLSEGIFPNHRTIRERRSDGEEEERRLMYVAVTRAMQHLYLTDSEGQLSEGNAFKYPSRFIGEIKEEDLVIEGNWRPELLEGTRMMVEMLAGESATPQQAAYQNGEQVRHKVFGIGTVLGYDSDNDSYRVQFECGTRNLLARVLTPLSTDPATN